MNPVRHEGRKVYIEGVRRLSWDTGEMCEFASALVAALECLGQSVPYHEVTAACGAAFRFVRSPSRWWPGHYSVRNIAADPYEPARRAFRWMGRQLTVAEQGEPTNDTARITGSIDRGVPVLAFNVVGPTDVCVLSGYDEGGAVLMGWSTFQDIPDDHDIPHDSTGYFRKPDWHSNTPAYLLIGGPTDRPPFRQRALEVLRWCADLVRGSVHPEGWLGGLDALDAWAADLEDDAHFVDGGPMPLGGLYLSVAADVAMLEDRRAAVAFLHQVAREEPDLAREAEAAAGHYSGTVAIREEMGRILPDDFRPGAMERLADRSVRRAYAECIRGVRRADERALHGMEALLTRQDAKAGA